MGNISQAEIARRWGVNRSRITQYKTAGMPVDNIDGAFNWLAANYPDRAVLIMGDQAAAEEATPDNMIAPGPPTPPADTKGKDPATTLARLSTVENVCWLMFEQEKNRNNHQLIAPRAKEHRAAALAKMDAANKLAEYQLKTREVIQLSEVLEMLGKILAPVKSQLTGLPYTVAAQANPADEEQARKAISEAVETINESITTSLERLKGTE